MRLCAFIILSLSIFLCLNAQINDRIITPQLKGSIKFTENNGQWESEILFKSCFSGGAMFLQKDGFVLNFLNKKLVFTDHGEKKLPSNTNEKYLGHALKLEFVNSLQPQINKYQQGNDYENFFIGNDKSKWASNVKNFKQIVYENIYQNIDYEVLADGKGIKYNWRVKPLADVSQINIKYSGTDHIKIDKTGNLIVKLAFKEIWEQKPYAYQLINGKVIEVKCNYKLSNNQISYELPNGYNKNFELIIDPIVVFSASLGSTSDNFGMTATYDNQGHLYSGGMIYDVSLPGSLGAYDNTFNNVVGYGRTDVFISKYTPNGAGLVYSTYLGGSQSEAVSSLIVDNSGNLCLYGVTASTNFPSLPQSAYPNFNGGSSFGFYQNGIIFCGGSDIYISKLNPSGSSLLATTFYGGSGNDGVNYLSGLYAVSLSPAANACQNTFLITPYDSLVMNYGDQFRGEIQVDKLNNIYIVSSTRSSNIPIIGGFDNTINGEQDAIVAKFNTNLTNLLFSSFIGGSKNDCGNSIALDNSNNIFVTGGTCSNDLLGTAGGHIPSFVGGKTDGFLYKINPTGSTILNATYIGTTDYDNSFFVTTDKKNKVYVYGQSYGNMPVIAAPTSTSGIYSVPNTHQFISAYTNSLTSLYFSTKFGSKTIAEADISPSAFAVDVCGNIYLSGWGGGILTNTVAMSGMPTYSAIPGFSVPPDGYDFYFMGLDSNAINLKFGSYFGGPLSEEHVDGGTSRFDPSGRIYQSICAGCSTNDDFPIIPSTSYPCGISPCPPGPNLSVNCNNGVIKLDFQIKVAVATINNNAFSGCTPLTVSFTNATAPTSTNSSFIWYNGLGGTNTTNINPSFTYTAPGIYTVALVVFDPTSCNYKDSTTSIITVFPKPNAAFNALFSPCSNTLQLNNLSTGSLTSNSYTWNLGSTTSTLTNPTYTYPTQGTYTISLNISDVNGCSHSTQTVISLFNFTTSVVGGTICQGQNIVINANGGTSYTWSPNNSLNNPNLASPIANPSVNTIYTVQIENNSAGYPCNKTLTTNVIVNYSPTASFSYSQNSCGGGVYFTSTSSTNSASHNWTLSPIVTSTLQNPYNFYGSGGTQNIILVVTTTAGCTDSYSETITVITPPPIAANATPKICLGESAVLTASGGVTYSWTPSQTLTFPNAASTTANPTVNTTYSVVITTSTGCQFVLVTSVIVDHPSSIPVSANANPQVVVLGNNSTLTFIGDPGAIITWYPLGSTVPTTGYTVSATPSISTTYTAIAQYGVCKNNSQVKVDVTSNSCIDKDTFVPNTFTPNGDGSNDNLFVRSAFITQIYFAVYNRWGELVFETTDKNKGWDGLYKGRPADVGVFGWYLKVKCPNGEENFKKGNVTLIR